MSHQRCGVITGRTKRPCQRPAVNGGPCAWHDPKRKPAPKFWTRERLRDLAALIEFGRADAQIGKHFGVTAEAVNLARKRHGIRARSTYLMSARAVAKMLGIRANEKTIAWWITQGYLKGRRGQPWGSSRQWYIEREHLFDFLNDSNYWHLWDPERIPDPSLRYHYRSLRTERYLTTREVAERFYVEHPTVHRWIQADVLPAGRRGNWLVPESALVDFIPPGQRSKAGMTKRAWSAHEDATLVDLRSRDWSWRRIAVSMGRTIGSVANRYRRLAVQRWEQAA